MQLSMPLINSQLNNINSSESINNAEKKVVNFQSINPLSQSAPSNENGNIANNNFTEVLEKIKANQQLNIEPENIVTNNIESLNIIEPQLLNLAYNNIPQTIETTTSIDTDNDNLTLAMNNPNFEHKQNLNIISDLIKKPSNPIQSSKNHITITNPILETEYSQLNMVDINDFVDKNPKFKEDVELTNFDNSSSTTPFLANNSTTNFITENSSNDHELGYSSNNLAITNSKVSSTINSIVAEDINQLVELMTDNQTEEQIIANNVEQQIVDHLRQLKQNLELAQQKIKNNVMTDDDSLIQLDMGKITKTRTEKKENWQNVNGALEEQSNLVSTDNSSSQQIAKIIQTELSKHNTTEAKNLENIAQENILNNNVFIKNIEDEITKLEASLDLNISESETLLNESNSNNIAIKNIDTTSNKLDQITSLSSNNKFQPIHEQVRLVINKNIADKNDVVTVQLEPHSLGKLEIMLNYDENKLATLTIKAEKKESLELLQKDFKILERNLEANGIKIAESNINFGLMNDFRQGSNQQREFMENYSQVFEQNTPNTKELLLDLNNLFKSNPNLQLDILA